MSVLTIHHQTIYRYRTPMAFGPHRLMLRPRESHALRLYQHELAITPAAVVTWAHDVAGNSVATASFSEPSDTLTIDSAATLAIDADRWPVFDIAASAQRFPFLLSEDEMTDLGALRLQAYLDSAGRVREWAQSFVAGAGTDTLSLLKDISAGVAAQIAYETREDEGAQSPDETLARRSGSCRDFAVLFVDAVRSLKTFFHMSAADGGRRVVIVDAAEELNRNAANAILKELEEPPAKTTILLIAHQPSRLLPTIRSRCRELRCGPLSADDLQQALAQAGHPSVSAESLAALAGGSPARPP